MNHLMTKITKAAHVVYDKQKSGKVVGVHGVPRLSPRWHKLPHTHNPNKDKS